MSYGPLEYVVIGFEGNRFRGEIVPALQSVIDQGVVRIVDLLFVLKDADGNVSAFELEDVDTETAALFGGLGIEPDGLFSEEDVIDIGESLENNNSAAFVLIEHIWAAGLREAIVNAGGFVVSNGLVSAEALDVILTPGDDE